MGLPPHALFLMKRLLRSLEPFALAAGFAVSFCLSQAFFAGFDIGGGEKKSLSSCRSTLHVKTDAYFLPSIFHTPGFTSEDCNETSTLSRCLWTTVVLSVAVEQP